jgi:predicted  nucleic acid-binding Zn-ribbon protein
MSRGAQLLELQQVEETLRQKIGAFKKIERVLAEETPVARARQAYEEAERAERHARAQQTGLNLELQQLNDKITAEEKKLYGGEVKNPKELVNLEVEVGMLKKQKDALEGQVIVLMGDIEDLGKRAAMAKADCERLEQESQAQVVRLRKEQDALKKEIGRAKRTREGVLERIASTDVEQFRYVQRMKGATFAVAQLTNGVCSACHVEVSASKRSSVERPTDNKLNTCGNCGRILVIV